MFSERRIFLKEIKVRDAVGQILCHDVTQIVRGVVKDAKFRKGHVITAEDIPELLKLGKENIFVWENDETKLHENDAAEILRGICQGENLIASDVKEGKIELKAEIDGVFHVNAEKLNEINAIDEICIATVQNDIPVRKNKSVAGMRVIPLAIDKKKLEIVQKIAENSVPLMKIAPYKKFKVGLVVTGSEIFHERIKDDFTPVIEAKLKNFGLKIDERRISDDSKAMTREKIQELLDLGCEMILCTQQLGNIKFGRVTYDLNQNIATYDPPINEPAKAAIFLVPGKDDTIESWFKVGGANLMEDKLLAQGKTKPCLLISDPNAGNVTKSDLKFYTLKASDYKTWKERRAALEKLLTNLK